MSELVVKQIEHLDGGSNEVSIPSLDQRFAKAWCTYVLSSGTPSISGSYNVLSIIDNGVGNYTVNFLNNLAVPYMQAGAFTSNGGIANGNITPIQALTNSFTFRTIDNANNIYDPASGGVLMFGSD